MATVVRAFIASYRRHMEAEETVVFPAALANLGEADWNEVEAKLAARQDSLFGERGEKRFAALCKFVLQRATNLASVATVGRPGHRGRPDRGGHCRAVPGLPRFAPVTPICTNGAIWSRISFARSRPSDGSPKASRYPTDAIKP